MAACALDMGEEFRAASDDARYDLRQVWEDVHSPLPPTADVQAASRLLVLAAPTERRGPHTGYRYRRAASESAACCALSSYFEMRALAPAQPETVNSGGL